MKLISAICSCASILLVYGSTAFSQTPTTYTESIQTLEAAIAARPLATPDDKRQFVANAVELCRLLPIPDDQVRLLSKAADTRQTTDNNLAYELAAEAQKRLRRWREIDRAYISQDVETTLVKLMDVIKPIIELFEPADLIRRFKGMRDDSAKIAELTPDEKAILYTRGIPRVSLGIGSDSPDTLPRELAELLAGRLIDPTLPKLLEKANAVLGVAEIRTGFPDQTSAVAAEMMSILFARTLGLDGNDLRPGGDLDKPEYWQMKAESLGQKHLWRWETMARILQAATSYDAAARGAAVQSANDAWANVQEVHNALADANATGADAWPAVPDWIARLAKGTAEALDARDKLPLSPDFRSRGRIRRANLEAEFLQARNAQNQADAFRLMQQCKTAELTLIGNATIDAAIDVGQLQKVIGLNGQPKPRDIHIFIELFQTGMTTGSNGSLHAFVLRTPTATIGATTEFEPTILLTAEATTAGMTGLLNDAIGTLTESANLHILVALGGAPRGVDWAEAEKVLLNRVSGPQGWMVYLPTAAVFAKNSPWTRAPTIRAWYQSLGSDARATGLSFTGTACEISNFALADVNDIQKHGMVKISPKAATRPQPELGCGEGWSKRARQFIAERRGGVLDIPMIVAAEAKR